ncbi:MAG: tetratricopeptide repeat protein [Treponema sp.]|nr:tetratricopeptide repeat protein [Treponema sp.]
MKNHQQAYRCFFSVMLFLCAVFPVAPVDELDLEAGIAQIAREIEQALPTGTRIAVISFHSSSARFSAFVIEELQGTFIQNRKMTVVNRKNLELRRKELDFQMSGEVNEETMISLGHALGVQFIVTGMCTDMGEKYQFRFNAFDIDTTVYQVSSVVTVRRDSTMAYLLPADNSPPPAVVPVRPDPELATRYFNAGFAHYEAGEYREAIVDFNRVMEITKDDIDTLYYRSCSHYYLNNYDKAIADLSVLIRLKPNNEVYYNNAYVMKGDYVHARADWEQVVRINPNHSGAKNNLEVLKKQGH